MTRTDDTEMNLTLALIQTPILTLTRVTMADRDDTETIAISDMTYAMVMETGTLVKEGMLMKRPSRRAPHARAAASVPNPSPEPCP